MGLKAYDRNINQVFSNIQYDVDFYQREYKWTDDASDYQPVSSLLRDIFYRYDQEPYNPNKDINEENIAKLEWYYLNTFMTNEVKGKKYIVDGQQRLTTLTLILIGLFHLSKEHKLPSYICDTLKNSFVGNTEFGKKFWMGFKDREKALDDLFENNLDYKHQPSNISEKNIQENYKIIYSILKNKFSTPHQLQTFISYFKNRIFLIEIVIDKDKDVAMVFEVINDRGVPLKPYEILKGKILSQIDRDDREGYINEWEKQVLRIEEYGENHIDEFFGYFFRSKYAENGEQYNALDQTRYHKSVFTEEYDKKIGLKNNEGNARKFVKEILPFYVDIYIEMLKYCKNYDKDHEFIYFNALNQQYGQFVLTLSAIDIGDKERDEKIKIIPKFFDSLFVLSNLTASYSSKEFTVSNVIILMAAIRNQSIKIAEINFYSQLFTLVGKKHNRKQLDEAFKYDFFKNVGYNTLGKTFRRYFFARIDHYISDSSDLPEYGNYYQLVIQTNGGDVYHIEHILTDREENMKLFKDEEEFNNERNRLGDLLLLKGKDNESSNDELYYDPTAKSDKVRTYNVSGTYFARTLLNDMYNKKVGFKNFVEENKLNFKPYPEKYTKMEIEERHKLLFELSKRIWNFNTVTLEEMKGCGIYQHQSNYSEEDIEAGNLIIDEVTNEN